MKLKVIMTDAVDAKATRTFDKIRDTATDGQLKDIVRKYIAFTTADSVVPSKITETPLDL